MAVGTNRKFGDVLHIWWDVPRQQPQVIGCATKRSVFQCSTASHFIETQHIFAGTLSRERSWIWQSLLGLRRYLTAEF